MRLSETGDPLVKLAALVDFETFRPRLDGALKRSDRSKGGRPPMDAVLMFKILILQTLYTLSDDATEFQVRDRLSFMRFLKLGLEDTVPDATTIWLFREQLTRAGAIEDLFAAFDGFLRGKGYLAMSGQYERALNSPQLWAWKIPHLAPFRPPGMPGGGTARRRRCWHPSEGGAARWSRLGNS